MLPACCKRHLRCSPQPIKPTDMTEPCRAVSRVLSRRPPLRRLLLQVEEEKWAKEEAAAKVRGLQIAVQGVKPCTWLVFEHAVADSSGAHVAADTSWCKHLQLVRVILERWAEIFAGCCSSV